MNDRYLFKGKRIDNDEWIIGYYEEANGKSYINYEEAIEKYGKSLTIIRSKEVIPETVGQCTGRNDENGKMIFENDIVKGKQSGNYYFIKWFSECACYSLADKYGEMSFGRNEFEMYLNDLIVIGNIHDNPELLEVKE